MGHWLAEHAKGYISANSRIWRSWVDVDFYPFDSVPEGVVRNAGSINKYDVAYQLSRFKRPAGMAPSWAWIRNPIIVDFLYSTPEELWQLHAVSGRSQNPM